MAGVVAKLANALSLSVLFDGVHPRDPALADWFGGTQTAAGIDVTEERALAIPALFAGISFYAETVSSLPIHVYRQRPNGEGYDVASDNSTDFLLHTAPNDFCTAKVFRRQLEMDRWLWGNAYAKIEFAGGTTIASLTRVPPWDMEPKYDTATQTLTYEHKPTGIPFDRGKILHFPCMGFDGYKGKSVIQVARETVGSIMATHEHKARFYGNGAQVSGVLEHPGRLADNARVNIRKEWYDVHGGPSRAGKVAVLWEGMKFNATGMSHLDAQFLETMQLEVSDVARLLNLPPHILRDLTRSTNNNIEHQGIELVVYSLLPVVTLYEQEYDRKLLQPPALITKHNLNGLLRGDVAARGEFYNSMLDRGVFTINDVLRREDMNTIGPDGDRRFVPLNMVPLDKVDEMLEKEKQPTSSPEGKMPEGKMPAKPPAKMPARQSLDSPLVREHVELLRETLHRMGRIEVTAITRAAKTPGTFLATVNGFYAEHKGRMAQALELPLRCYALAVGVEPLPLGELVERYVAKQMERLLAATECQPTELAGRVAEALSDEQFAGLHQEHIEALQNDRLLCAA